MASLEKTGRMICDEGMWEQRDGIYAPGEIASEQDTPMGCELDECEVDGELLASGSVLCKRGDCGICYRGEWLLS